MRRSEELLGKAKLMKPRVCVKGKRIEKGDIIYTTPPSKMQSKNEDDTELTEIVEETIIQEGRVGEWLEEGWKQKIAKNMKGRWQRTKAELDEEFRLEKAKLDEWKEESRLNKEESKKMWALLETIMKNNGN